MPALRSRRLLLAVAVSLAVTLPACGFRGSVVDAGSEGEYARAGPLTYQVQLSRELNPADIEDQAYFQGIPPAQRTLPRDQEWFGVFLQVRNETATTEPVAQEVTISDTQGHVYRPVRLSSDNVFAYQPGAYVPAQAQLPSPASLAFSGPTQGLVVLFKIAQSANQNRPLILTISPFPREPGTVDIDL